MAYKYYRSVFAHVRLGPRPLAPPDSDQIADAPTKAMDAATTEGILAS